MERAMKIDQLNKSQLQVFSENAKAIAAFLGGRKFATEMMIDGKTQKVRASAKEVYAAFLKANLDDQTVNHFRATELETRDSKVFSKQLNCIQKIYYFIVKKFFGMRWADTWSNKFIAEKPYQKGDLTFTNGVNRRAMAKVKKVLSSRFDGRNCEAVIVNVCGRCLEWISGNGGLTMPENAFNDYFFGGEPGHHYLYNPKVILINIGIDDPALPKDVKLARFTMSEKEYLRLSWCISKKFNDFMKSTVTRG